MEQIEIILRTTDPTGKVTEQLLAKFDTEKPATEVLLFYSIFLIKLEKERVEWNRSKSSSEPRIQLEK